MKILEFNIKTSIDKYIDRFGTIEGTFLQKIKDLSVNDMESVNLTDFFPYASNIDETTNEITVNTDKGKVKFYAYSLFWVYNNFRKVKDHGKTHLAMPKNTLDMRALDIQRRITKLAERLVNTKETINKLKELFRKELKSLNGYDYHYHNISANYNALIDFDNIIECEIKRMSKTNK